MDYCSEKASGLATRPNSDSVAGLKGDRRYAHTLVGCSGGKADVLVIQLEREIVAQLEGLDWQYGGDV